jgi:hypothetical protein
MVLMCLRDKPAVESLKQDGSHDSGGGTICRGLFPRGVSFGGRHSSYDSRLR